MQQSSQLPQTIPLHKRFRVPRTQLMITAQSIRPTTSGSEKTVAVILII